MMITSIVVSVFPKIRVQQYVSVNWIGFDSSLHLRHFYILWGANPALYLAAVLNAKWCHSLTCYKVH